MNAEIGRAADLFESALTTSDTTQRQQLSSEAMSYMESNPTAFDTKEELQALSDELVRRGLLAPLAIEGLSDETAKSGGWFSDDYFTPDDIQLLAEGKAVEGGTQPDAITQLAAMAVEGDISEDIDVSDFNEKYLNQERAVAVHDVKTAFNESQWKAMASDGEYVTTEDIEKALNGSDLTDAQRTALKEFAAHSEYFGDEVSWSDLGDSQEELADSFEEFEAGRDRVGAAPLVDGATIFPADLDDEKFNAMSELATVQKGEGFYQSAQRLLGDGAGGKEILALAHKLKAISEEQSGRDFDNGGVLKVGETLLTEDLLEEILNEFPAVREKYQNLNT
jgi:hypothetical protein